MKPLSYSEMMMYREYPVEHYQRYVLGIKKPSTPAMQLGTVIHARLENPAYDVVSALKRLQVPQSKIDGVVRLLLAAKHIPKLPQREAKLTATLKTGDELVSYLDGYDKRRGRLQEFKTTDNDKWWTQSVVDDFEQLSFYALMHLLNTGELLNEITLYALNHQKATVKVFSTSRTEQQLTDTLTRIITTINNMKTAGIWEQRLVKNITA